MAILKKDQILPLKNKYSKKDSLIGIFLFVK